MSKVSVENKNGVILITNRLSYPENVNEQLCSAISYGGLGDFFPLCVSRKRKEIILECNVQEYIPLTQYFGGLVTRKMFLDFMYDIAQIIKLCERYKISANNIEFNYDKIFIDPKTKKIKCIFWPVVNNQRETLPQVFLKQLPYDLNFNIHENTDYLNTYKSFFLNSTLFSVNSFEKMILGFYKQDTRGNSLSSDRFLSGGFFDTDNNKLSEKSFSHNENIEYNPIADEDLVQGSSEDEIKNTVCSVCGAQVELRSNFCSNCGNNLRKENVDLQDEGTFVVAKNFGVSSMSQNKLSEEKNNVFFPTLTRVKTKEVYILDKAQLSIGTDRTVCDIFVSNNHFISRKHADLIMKNNKYYLVDNNSTNKTMINGKSVVPYQEVELAFGADICLADEHFYFGTNF